MFKPHHRIHSTTKLSLCEVKTTKQTNNLSQHINTTSFAYDCNFISKNKSQHHKFKKDIKSKMNGIWFVQCISLKLSCITLYITDQQTAQNDPISLTLISLQTLIDTVQ